MPEKKGRTGVDDNGRSVSHTSLANVSLWSIVGLLVLAIKNSGFLLFFLFF